MGAGVRMRRGTAEAARTSFQSSLNASADLSNHYTCDLKGQELHNHCPPLCRKYALCTCNILQATLFPLIFKESLTTV